MTVDDLKAWEKKHGRLPKNGGVFLNSGWDAKAKDPKAFLGQDRSKTLHFPGFSKEACEFLLKEREVAGLAVDTLSLDFGASKEFAVHKLWLGAGKWGLECVANLSQLPPAGATVFVGGAEGGRRVRRAYPGDRGVGVNGRSLGESPAARSDRSACWSRSSGSRMRGGPSSFCPPADRAPRVAGMHFFQPLPVTPAICISPSCQDRPGQAFASHDAHRRLRFTSGLVFIV